MVREFTKKTTNVGGSTGIIIPKEVLYAEGISRGDTVRIIVVRASTVDTGADLTTKTPFRIDSKALNQGADEESESEGIYTLSVSHHGLKSPVMRSSYIKDSGFSSITPLTDAQVVRLVTRSRQARKAFFAEEALTVR